MLPPPNETLLWKSYCQNKETCPIMSILVVIESYSPPLTCIIIGTDPSPRGPNVIVIITVVVVLVVVLVVAGMIVVAVILIKRFHGRTQSQVSLYHLCFLFVDLVYLFLFVYITKLPHPT